MLTNRRRLDPLTMSCPTCGASQEWSDICRRCKCDLSSVRTAAGAYFEARRGFLKAFKSGNLGAAVTFAKRCHDLFPCEESQRFLAITELLSGDFPGAFRVAEPLAGFAVGRGARNGDSSEG